jgi:uncharacterized membrane protein YoaK (UPF0700 family)
MPPPVQPARTELAALMMLAFVTGLVDASSFLSLGQVFTANMTGNVIFLGFAAAGAGGVSPAHYIASLAAFLCGAIVGGHWSRTLSRGSRGKWLATGAVSESFLLLLAAVMAAVTLPPLRVYAVIVLTAFAMGLRNATIRSLAVADVATNVLTSTLTALASESSLAGGGNPRIGRRLGSVLLMFAGAFAGALLLRWGLAVTLATGGVIVGIATGVALLPPTAVPPTRTQ